MPQRKAREGITNEMNRVRDKVRDGGSAGEHRLIALVNEEECCSALHVEAKG